MQRKDDKDIFWESLELYNRHFTILKEQHSATHALEVVVTSINKVQCSTSRHRVSQTLPRHEQLGEIYEEKSPKIANILIFEKSFDLFHIIKATQFKFP